MDFFITLNLLFPIIKQSLGHGGSPFEDSPHGFYRVFWQGCNDGLIIFEGQIYFLAWFNSKLLSDFRRNNDLSFGRCFNNSY